MSEECIWDVLGGRQQADMSGHYWAEIEAAAGCWTWRVVDYQDHVVHLGESKSAADAKQAVEEWDRWVCQVRTGYFVCDRCGE